MYAATSGFQRPGGQRHVRHGLAGGNVGCDCLSNLGPTGCLPGLKWPLCPTKAPTHGQIKITGIVSNVFELHRAVVENIAENCPQELCLRMG